MRLIFGLALILCAAIPTFARAAAPIDSTAALARARELRPHVSTNTPGPLWTSFDATMRTAMGDSTRFAAALDGIHAQVGTILSVISEEMSMDRGMWVYRASCRFEKAPEPLLLLIAVTPEGKVSGLAVRPGEPKEYASTKLDYVTKTELHLPFRDEWFVFWGGRTLADNYHAASKSQRFAYDMVIVKDASSHKNDGKELTDYYCYGAEILAPAAGQIVWSCDSLPNQSPGSMDPSHPVGNGVVIDHKNGEFSLIAHLQPKSQPFKVGDSVKLGDVVGKCGNSGNTTEPHLHYHLQDGPDIKTAEGLPAPFVGICVDGTKQAKAEPKKNQKIKPCP
jgi:hypothetical protein